MGSGAFQTNEKIVFDCKDELLRGEAVLPNYNLHVINLLSKNYTKTTFSLDFGAGIGTLAQKFTSIKGNKPDCFEIDPTLCEILKSRGFNVLSSRNTVNKNYEYVYTSNVLEHIKDDIETLKWLNSIMAEGGILSIYVPAHNIIYSKFDNFAGHYRRYNYKDLNNKLTNSGFKVIEYRYVDSIGFFTWLLLKHVNITSKSGVASSNSLAFYDKCIFPISLVFDRIFKKLFGKNIYISAIKI
jgi:hypothetical protein